ncbi:MAG: dsbE [Francisellaceae bacterium]|nr:dsbE [Francisellaceae bacterium]
MKPLSFLISFSVFLLLGFFLFKGLHLNPYYQSTAFVNQKAPYFSLPNLFELSHMIKNNYFDHKNTLVNVWASWCDNCLQEHAFLMKLSKEYPNLHLLGVNYKDSYNEAKHYLNKYKNPYQKVLFDPEGLLGKAWGVYGSPESFAINNEGVICYRHIGILTEDIWEKKIKSCFQHLKS